MLRKLFLQMLLKLDYCFVDAYHGGYIVTCPSHTGVLILINRAHIASYSKSQITVEIKTWVRVLYKGICFGT